MRNFKLIIIISKFRPSDFEADDEDTQDGDSLSHLRLDSSLTDLNIQEASVVASCNENSVQDAATTDTTEVSSVSIFFLNSSHS